MKTRKAKPEPPGRERLQKWTLWKRKRDGLVCLLDEPPKVRFGVETVIQFHPPEADYVNIHRYCLHLWRKVGVNCELPPMNAV